MTADEQQKIIKSARAIREHLHALGGPDLSDLSDNELVEKFTRVFETMTSALKNAGVAHSSRPRNPCLRFQRHTIERPTQIQSSHEPAWRKSALTCAGVVYADIIRIYDLENVMGNPSTEHSRKLRQDTGGAAGEGGG